MDFNKFMQQVREALGLPKDATLEETVSGVVTLNKRTAELESGIAKMKTDLDEFADEMRKRAAAGEKMDSAVTGFHFTEVGGKRMLMPNVSRECGEHLVQLARGNRVLSAGVDAEGGYLVAPEFAAEIIRLIPTVGIYARIARHVPMGSDELNFGTLVSSLGDYWPAENTAITPSYPGFGQLKLVAKIHAAMTKAPENLLDDATPELGQFLADLFIECLANGQDRVGFAGNTGGGDPFNGLLFATGVNSLVMAATKTKISDVTADHLLDLQTTVPDGAREGCVYLLSPTVFDAVRKLKDSTGDYIWQRPTDGAPGTIWGKPYELSEKFPAYSTAADPSKAFIVYGNPRYAILGDRKQIAVKASDVAGDAFEKIQTAIRAHERIAINSYGAGFAKLVTAAA